MKNERPYTDIGNRLRALRSAHDMTQRAWADTNAFGQAALNNWETGTRRINLDDAEKLVARYGVTLDWIYLGRPDAMQVHVAIKLNLPIR